MPAVFASEVLRRPGFTLFAVLVTSQLGHQAEHFIQMGQIHLLHRPLPAARGAVGALDIEWVHFTWNTWILVAVIVLVVRYRFAGHLMTTLLAVCGWHALEHTVILAGYLASGTVGAPGLAASGGLLWGGLPFRRPELHLLYNLPETVLLVVAFWQAARRRPLQAGTVSNRVNSSSWMASGSRNTTTA